MSSKKPRTIALSPELVGAIQQQMQIIASKEAELAMLRAGLEMFLGKQTGVNLAAENWQLDTTHWTLSKES